MTLKVISTLTSGRISGVDVFAIHLTRGLRHLGVDARILLTEPDEGPPDPMPLPEDLPIEVLDVAPGDPGRRRRRELFCRLEDHAPCIYLPNYDYRHSVVSSRVSNRVGVVGILHSDDPLHYEHMLRLGKYWNAIVAVSSTIAERAKSLHAPFSNRLCTIPYGIDYPERWRPRRREPGQPIRLLYAGRIEHQQKRVTDLVKVLDALVERHIPATLTMVGSGAGKNDVLEAGRKHLVKGRLVVLDTVPNYVMPKLYETADVFVLASAYEGMPVGLLEAMGHGCVGLVTQIASGVPEIVKDGVNGYRVPVGDIQAFVDRIEKLQADPHRWEQLSRAAHDVILTGDFSIERMARSYLDLFEKIEAQMQSGAFRRPYVLPGEPFWRRLYLKGSRLMRQRAGWLTEQLAPPMGRWAEPSLVRHAKLSEDY